MNNDSVARVDRGRPACEIARSRRTYYYVTPYRRGGALQRTAAAALLLLFWWLTGLAMVGLLADWLLR